MTSPNDHPHSSKTTITKPSIPVSTTTQGPLPSISSISSSPAIISNASKPHYVKSLYSMFSPMRSSTLFTRFVWDPCGITCVTFGVFTVLLVDFVTVFHVIQPWISLKTINGLVHASSFQIVIILILASYCRAATTDPGLVPKNKCKDETDKHPKEDDPDVLWKPKNRRWCKHCNTIKPPRAHHCSTCGRCVIKMDHHCPWVNNCVGSNNYKFFLLFLFWTFVGSLYAAIMGLTRVATCWGAMTTRWYGIHYKQGQPIRDTKARLEMVRHSLFLLAGKDTCDISNVTTIILFVSSIILAIFFVAFTACMASDQFQTLTTDVTGIEYMKEWEENPQTAFQGLLVACGEPFSIYWFLPVSLPRQCSSYYEWSPLDDLDAYDPRDPIIKRHLSKIAKGLKEKEAELEKLDRKKKLTINTDKEEEEEEEVVVEEKEKVEEKGSGAGAVASLGKDGIRRR